MPAYDPTAGVIAPGQEGGYYDPSLFGKGGQVENFTAPPAATPTDYSGIMDQWNYWGNIQQYTPPNDLHFQASSQIQMLNDQMYGLGSYAGQGPMAGAADYWARPENSTAAIMGAQDRNNWVNSNHQMGPQGSAIQNNFANAAAYPGTGLPPGMEAPWMQQGWLNTPQSVTALSNLGQPATRGIQSSPPPGPAQSPAFTGQPSGNAGPRTANNWGIVAGQMLDGGNGGRSNYMGAPSWLRPLFGG